MKNNYGAFVLLVLIGGAVAFAFKPAVIVPQDKVDHLALSSVEHYEQELQELNELQAQLLANEALDPSDILSPTAAGPQIYDCNHYNILAIDGVRFSKHMADNGMLYALFAYPENTFGIVEKSQAEINILPRDDVPEEAQAQLEKFLPTLKQCHDVPTSDTTPSNYPLSPALAEKVTLKDCEKIPALLNKLGLPPVDPCY